MPRLTRPDGVEIHWEEHGRGPLVVIATWWSLHPSVLEPLTAELERDHRVVSYHDRGSGESTRAGPYDLDTAADDLGAVIEAAVPPAVIIGAGDGPNRGVRVAARRPDLVRAVVGVGGAPLDRALFADSDVLAASDTVVAALLQQVETDYRGALRGILAVTNRQLSDDQLRRRIVEQARFSPPEAAIPRLRAWAEDRPLQFARTTGERLWVLISEQVMGGWFPVGPELLRLVRDALPEAHVVEVDDGLVSRADQTAAVVRGITGVGAAGSATEVTTGDAQGTGLESPSGSRLDPRAPLHTGRGELGA
jgi:pimeloyl-ACP methyl ester carboxylesterase